MEHQPIYSESSATESDSNGEDDDYMVIDDQVNQTVPKAIPWSVEKSNKKSTQKNSMPKKKQVKNSIERGIYT